MTTFTRRQFFAKICGELAEKIPGPASTQARSSARAPSSDPWHVVGRMARCEPGQTITIDVMGRCLRIRSDARGVWAETESGARVALKASSQGLLWADLNQLWPATRILSHATYQPIDLNPGELQNELR